MSQTKTYSRNTQRYSGRSTSRYEQEYVYGSAVRRLEPEREEPKRREEPRRAPVRKQNASHLKKQRQQQRISKKNQQRALAMNMGYVAFLAAATIACAAACLFFIGAQSKMTASMKQVEALESQIEELQTQNNVLENQIAASIDINNVKRRAESYGMSYPTEDQIVHYSVNSSDYMDQYIEVPAR